MARNRIDRAQRRRQLLRLASALKDLRSPSATICAPCDPDEPPTQQRPDSRTGASVGEVQAATLAAATEQRVRTKQARSRLRDAGDLIHPRPWGANPKAYTATQPVHNPFQPPRCQRCREALVDNKGELQHRVVTKAGASYHPDCFCCSMCRVTLQQGDSATYFERDGALFCAEDFRAVHGKQCGVCHARLLVWSTMSGQAYCPEHEGKFPVCLGCATLVPPSSQGASLPDGRCACQPCAASAVDDETAAQELMVRVCDFFRQMGLVLPARTSNVQLQLLDVNELTAMMRAKSGNGAHTCPLAVTCTERTEHLSTGRIVSRRVSSIAMVSSLPEDVALTTLAHEAGHVFLHLAGLDDRMGDRAVEGLCELFSYLWEHGQCIAGKADQREQTRRRRRMEGMLQSPDEIYGAGFRDALAAFRACGYSLTGLLDRVKDSGGCLPKADGPQAESWARRSGRGFLGRGVYRPVGQPQRNDTRRRALIFDAHRRNSEGRASRASTAGDGRVGVSL
jgi:hypothetical protein